MPKVIKSYTIYFVYEKEEDIFAENALLPNIPPRFALVENSTSKAKGTQRTLVCLCEGDKVLHWLSMLGMGVNDLRLHGSPSYFTMDEFIKMARATFIIPAGVNFPEAQ